MKNTDWKSVYEIEIETRREHNQHFTLEEFLSYSDEEKSDRILWDNDMPRALSATDFDENNEVDSTKLVDKNVEFNAEKPTILYVDDNIDLIENMSDYFTDNYNIYTAENGEMGVEMANKLQLHKENHLLASQ